MLFAKMRKNIRPAQMIRRFSRELLFYDPQPNHNPSEEANDCERHTVACKTASPFCYDPALELNPLTETGRERIEAGIQTQRRLPPWRRRA